jgi:hypothetical protein
MTDTDWNAYVDAVAPALGLTIAPEWKPAVAAWVGTAAKAAALFVDLPLDHASDEPAPVFRSGAGRSADEGRGS